jgi:hypothetical protein
MIQTDSPQIEMSHNGSLNQKKQRALNALIISPTIEEAAIQSGVSRRTLTRWLQEESFRLELQNIENEAIEANIRKILCLANLAIDTLRNIMEDQNISPNTRRASARDVLLYFTQFCEIRSLNERLSFLEMKEVEDD